jgi:hypothetical protein
MACSKFGESSSIFSDLKPDRVKVSRLDKIKWTRLVQ